MAHPSLYYQYQELFNRYLRTLSMVGTMICVGDIVMSGIREDRQISNKCSAELYNNIVQMKLIGCF